MDPVVVFNRKGPKPQPNVKSNSRLRASSKPSSQKSQKGGSLTRPTEAVVIKKAQYAQGAAGHRASSPLQPPPQQPHRVTTKVKVVTRPN